MKNISFAFLLIIVSCPATANEITGQLIFNETSIEEACKLTHMADSRCSHTNDYVLAAIIVPSNQSKLEEEIEAVTVIVNKTDFAKFEGKKVKAKYSPGQFAEIIEN